MIAPVLSFGGAASRGRPECATAAGECQPRIVSKGCAAHLTTRRTRYLCHKAVIAVGDAAASAGMDARRRCLDIDEWIKLRQQIYMLVVYPKSKKDDLSDKETAILRELVKEL